MAAFGHRKAAESPQLNEVTHQLAVTLSPQIADSAAEKAPLHSGLHHQRQVGVAEHFNPGECPAGISCASLVSAESTIGHAGLKHLGQRLGGVLPGLLHGQPRGGPQGGVF